MILVTIGTSEPFDRLLRAVGLLGYEEEIVAQCGTSLVRPAGATCVDYFSFDDLLAEMKRARAVVMHAGAGSILAALSMGVRPLVVPRLRRFGEAVDDHQVEFARRLDSVGLVELVEDVERLPDALASPAAGGTPLPTLSAGCLARELRAYLSEQVASGNRRRSHAR